MIRLRVREALLLLGLFLVFPLSTPGQTPAVEPADALRPAAVTTRDVPVVPDELLQRLQQYQNSRGAGFAGWAPDGTGLLVQTRFAETVHLHRVYEPGGRREQWTFYEEPVLGRFVPGSERGAVLVSMAQGGDENYQIELLERDPRKVQRFTDGASRNLLGPILHDGSRAVIQSNRRNERDMDLYVADLRRPGTQELLLNADGNEWAAQDWSRDGALLLLNRIVSVNETYPAVMDVASRSLRPLPAPAQGQFAFWDLAFAPDARSAYVTTDARGEFLQLARLDLHSGQYQFLTEDIPWDVEEIEVEPVTGRVAFVMNENGASKLGIALIAPNVRGSSGYGKSFLKLDNAELREDSVKDVGALLDWIQKQPELDASRVAVSGGSYGGYMVLASLIHFGDRIRAGIDVVSIANFITFLEKTSAYRQDLRRVEYGDERDPAMRAHFERINPTSHADRIRSALLIAHGTNDPRVPLFEAEQIAEKVRASGQKVWTVYAGNEGHGFARKENRDYLSAVTAMFLQKHLLGEGAALGSSEALAPR